MTNMAVRVGAVAAGPSAGTIWEGMRAYFEDAGVIVEIYPQNAQAVQFGEPLMAIRTGSVRGS